VKSNNIFAAAILAVFFCLSATAKDAVNTKFGKPTKEELTMTTYAPDPDAEAVVLCRLTDVEYSVQTDGYLVDYHEKIRIKVLKPEGAKYAQVTIPYYVVPQDKDKLYTSQMALRPQHIDINGAVTYDEGASRSISTNIATNYIHESIEEVKATAYNMEGSKTTKSKFKGEVALEQLDDETWQARFTIPDVRQGTVIEYEYTRHSELFYRLHDWQAQQEIPVAYARLTVTIPRHLLFNFEQHGSQQLVAKQESSSMIYKLVSDPLAAPTTVMAYRYIFTGQDLKGAPSDPNVCLADYFTGVTAEVSSFGLRSTPPADYANTWEHVDQVLMADDNLGKMIEDHSPLREQLQAENIQTIANEQERAAAVCRLVFSHVKWNGKYAMWARNAQETLLQGGGNSADINMLLMQTLREAGLKVNPVVMRPRNLGALPLTFPTISKLTNYVVGVKTRNAGTVYVDASSPEGKLNTLPEQLQVERAHPIGFPSTAPWVSLKKAVNPQGKK
jgi:hypothetical protein